MKPKREKKWLRFLVYSVVTVKLEFCSFWQTLWDDDVYRRCKITVKPGMSLTKRRGITSKKRAETSEKTENILLLSVNREHETVRPSGRLLLTAFWHNIIRLSSWCQIWDVRRRETHWIFRWCRSPRFLWCDLKKLLWKECCSLIIFLPFSGDLFAWTCDFPCMFLRSNFPSSCPSLMMI